MRLRYHSCFNLSAVSIRAAVGHLTSACLKVFRDFGLPFLVLAYFTYLK
jgi:hypothetical protein